ncbi:uroporphyrinogen-III synthase [Microvirga flavescens]|uniref:uroporphyrinogen-III synthase n=1 Tax=Microvirga flavescens TaxID=2249811 RepID=UPI000DD85502|nr:uroporphyrinogen-III synthase [Microvirga flavescens]
MRVLVTRARPDAERTAKRLVALGHEAVIAPILEIVPTGAPRPPGPWEALIVTSAHAVPALAAIEDKDHLVFAVGGRTAEAVAEAGFTSILTAEGDAVSLAAMIRRDLAPGAALLHVTGLHHKAEPDASLRMAGFVVEVWEAYEARAVPVLPATAAEALRAGRIDAALHYSRRSVDILLRLVEEAGLSPAFRAFRHVCLSADVAAPLQGFAATPVAIAARPEEEALLQVLQTMQTFGKPSHRPS